MYLLDLKFAPYLSLWQRITVISCGDGIEVKIETENQDTSHEEENNNNKVGKKKEIISAVCHAMRARATG